MEEISITKMSSRGQVVIPLNMRNDLIEGENLVIIKNNNQIILKKASDFSENIKEDLEFARRTEEAWKAYGRGEFDEMEFDDFINKIEKW